MIPEATHRPEFRDPPACPVCGEVLLRLARGRKSGQPFVMLLCGRHRRQFRGFSNDPGSMTLATSGLRESVPTSTM
jgi:hypothetical protein